MKIFVKIISSGSSIILNVAPTTKIGEIKAKIANEKGIPITHQRIIISRKIANDWQSLVDFSVENNSVLLLDDLFIDHPSQPQKKHIIQLPQPQHQTPPLQPQIVPQTNPSSLPKFQPNPPIPSTPSPQPPPIKYNETCTVCHNPIQTNQLFYYSGYPYHKGCIECLICHKKYQDTENISDYISIAPTLFLCHNHYNEYLTRNALPKDAHDKYHEVNKKNFVTNALEPINLLEDEETKNYPPEEVFINSEHIQNSYQMNKPFDDFVPTIEFHFDKKISDIDFDQLQEFLGEDEIMLGCKEGSLIIKMTFLYKFIDKVTNINSALKEKFTNFVEKVKSKFTSSMGKKIVGNFVSDPKVIHPDENKIKEWYNKPSMNFLQNPYELNNIEIDEIMKEAIQKVTKEKTKRNWMFILSQEKIFDMAEEKVRKDIEENPFEMVIVGETIIANKFDDEYKKIKDKLKEDATETFFYHGSNLANHIKIVNTHFLMPGQDKNIKQLDSGYYGKGIYATENLFYATIYGNHYSLLLNNEKTSVIYCKAIYNKKKVRELDHLIRGEVISSDIRDNYGIHHALVGNTTGFTPIQKNDIKNNDIVASEYVFPTKYQIIPIFSFTIMKSDYLILWKDENIGNNENSNYMKELAKKMQVNIYTKKTWEDALEVVKKKRYNKIKLITNGGFNLTGKKLIEEAHKVIGSNFVCLVFAASTKHYEWVKEMDNVLFTTKPETFRKFASLNMNEPDILKFIQYVEDSEERKFKINKNDLLRFLL